MSKLYRSIAIIACCAAAPASAGMKSFGIPSAPPPIVGLGPQGIEPAAKGQLPGSLPSLPKSFPTKAVPDLNNLAIPSVPQGSSSTLPQSANPAVPPSLRWCVVEQQPLCALPSGDAGSACWCATGNGNLTGISQ